jgi:sugar O-acyltransferase (sialic acid O-acetyltransferase NeuD family)
VRCILCVNIAGTCCSMRIGIAGAGGHAKVVADALLAVGQIEFAGFLDDDPDSWGSQILGYRVLAPITAWSERKIDALVVAVGDNARRKQIFEQLTAAGAMLVSVVHPRAVIGRGVSLGRGAVVLANAVVNSGSLIGDNVILNTASSVDHDNQIASHVHLAPGVRTAGRVRIGEGAFLGIGASVLPNVAIGEWAIIGAGAVVTASVADRITVIGSPAKRPR